MPMNFFYNIGKLQFDISDPKDLRSAKIEKNPNNSRVIHAI